MKKYNKILLGTIMSLSLLTACSSNATEVTNDAQQSESAGEVKDLTLLYTNDIHAHHEPFIYKGFDDERPVGGFANLTTYFKQVKEEVGDQVLVMDAGDYFQGPSISTLTNGEAVIDIMNTMGYDIATIGNHEFDYGWENALEQLNKATFEIVQGNIFMEETDELFWDNPYTIINKNGVDVGVIGLHGDFAFYDTVSQIGTEGLVCKEEEEYLTQYIAELEDKTDIIVLLVHEGVPGKQSSLDSVDVERSLQKDMELAEKIPGIDILITGHAHVGTPEPIVVNDTIIVSTAALGSQVGRFDLKVDTENNVISEYTYELKTIYDDEIEGDPETQAAIDKWNAELETITSQVIGYTEVPLTRAYGDDSLLGNISADAILYAMSDYDPDFALNNSGGLRTDIDAGDITYGEVMGVVPFTNELVVMDYTGAQLKELFEHAAGLTNGVLQVSDGVVMTYNETAPVGSRLVDVTFNGESLKDDEVYTVALPDFLANGGDGYSTFLEGENRQTRVGYLLYTAVADYITYATEEGIMPTTSEDRIVVIK